jgi:hypothetical protein
MLITQRTTSSDCFSRLTDVVIAIEGHSRGVVTGSVKGGCSLYHRPSLSELDIVIPTGAGLGHKATGIDVLARSGRLQTLAGTRLWAVICCSWHGDWRNARRLPDSVGASNHCCSGPS